MRRAAIASIAIHAGLIGGAYWMMLSPAEPLAEAGGVPVMVQILDVERPNSSAADAVVSDATESMVAAGAGPVETVETEVAKLEVETAAVSPAAEAKPVESTEKAVEPVLAPELAAANTAADAMTPTAAEQAEPIRTAMLAPVSEEEMQVAPVPKPRLVRKEPEVRQEPAEKPEEPAPAKKRPQRRAAPAGNGGNAEANAAASAAANQGAVSDQAGQAAVSKYPGQVQSRLRRALRQPSNARGAQGEVHVRFVVAASGSVSGIAVVQSSGHDVLDAAAVATVKRAAPFPKIPAAAGRSSWTFTMPLSFHR